MATTSYIGVPNFVKRELPRGYIQLEYIESTGTQYIDTNIVIDPSTLPGFKVEADVEIIETSGVWSVSGCGAGSPCVYTGVRQDGNYGYGDGTMDATTGIDYEQSRRLYTLDVPNGQYTVSGILDIPVTINTPTGSQHYMIAAYDANSQGVVCHKEKIYGYKFYNNGALIRDYVPCKISGVVGLYDMVNGTFATNAGTGAFVEGALYKSVARTGKKVYFGNDSGIAKKAKKVYVGDSAGIARLFLSDSSWSWGADGDDVDEAWFDGLAAYLTLHSGASLKTNTGASVVGTTKRVTLTNAVLGTTTHLIQVIGVDQDDDRTVTWQTKNGLLDKTAFGGSVAWIGSTARSLCQSYYNAFPGKAHIKTVSKGTCPDYASGRNGTAVYNDETVFLLSEREFGLDQYSVISVANSTTSNAECTKGKNFSYAYYTNDASRIKYRGDDQTEEASVMERSRSSNLSGDIAVVYKNGRALQMEYKNQSAAFAPAFVIGGLNVLTFSAPDTFSLSVANPGWDGTMEYLTDAETWQTWDGSEISGKALCLRGTGNTKVTGGSSYIWTLTGSNISCEGNIETLLDYATVEAGNHPTMASNCYHSMFRSCTGLITTPALPATTLTDFCYKDMFSYCKNLTTAPTLPAMTLAQYCYAAMFDGCTNLTMVPALPATTLERCCYEGMFDGCTNIKLSSTKTGTYTQAYRIPTSGTGTTATNALSDMFISTGGTFTGTPTIDTTYYLDSSCSIIGVGGGKLISFTVDNSVYYAEEGMTWTEFVNSEYNDESMTVGNGYVYTPYGDISDAEPDGVIIPGKAYTTVAIPM